MTHAALNAALGVSPVEEMDEEEDEDDRGFLRPGKKRVEKWMGTWWRRWAVLVGAPCLLVRASPSWDPTDRTDER